MDPLKTPESRLFWYNLPVAGLAATCPADLAEQVDAWLWDGAVMLTRDVLNRPRPDALAEPGPAGSMGHALGAAGVVWVSGMPSGAGLFSGPDVAAATILLTPASWLTPLDAVSLAACSSEALAEDGRLLPALASFHTAAFALERLNWRLAVVDQANLERARATSRRSDEEGARRRLVVLSIAAVRQRRTRRPVQDRRKGIDRRSGAPGAGRPARWSDHAGAGPGAGPRCR